MARVALLYDAVNHNYSGSIRNLFVGHSLAATALPQSLYLINIVGSLTKHNIEYAFFSSPKLLKLILKAYKETTSFKESSDSYKAYWGASWKIGNCVYVCIPELDSVNKFSYGKFLIERYIKKTLHPESFITPPELIWDYVDLEQSKQLLPYIDSLIKKSILVSLDIETRPVRVTEEFGKSKLGFGLASLHKTKHKKDNQHYITQIITIVGYTFVYPTATGGLTSRTIVIPYKGMENYELIKKVNACDVPKVMQNGRYDVIHTLVNNAPIANWRYDTLGLMHSWYVELPKSLEFISGFILRDYMYWKDESGHDLALYNAKDCHTTAWACIGLLMEMPDWAIANFKENFIQVFPCITCSLEGFAVDWNEFERKKTSLEVLEVKAKEAAEYVFGEGFNPNSPIQVKRLLNYFGLPSATSSDAKSMQKFSEISEWHSRLISYVTDYRKVSKELSTYFNFAFLGDRWLFDLDPFGTETGRYASKKSSLWVGQQGQNFPASARSPYIPDPTYYLGASDNEQSESRCTAYMSEDKKLIYTVENSPDFHKTNASLFFGMPFGEVTDIIRKLGKKVNHGANYNMGSNVLIESMGAKALITAKRLLKLPSSWGLKEVATHLLKCFDNTYPDIKGKYYKEVIDEVKKTSKLVGPTGWTRYCFGDPSKSKLVLNSYVAHGPQSLSVKAINRAFFKAWYEYQFKEEIIRMKMQKHDEIIWQNLPKHNWVGEKISKIMAEPTIVRGRSMVIPNAPEVGKLNWGEIGH